MFQKRGEFTTTILKMKAEVSHLLLAPRNCAPAPPILVVRRAPSGTTNAALASVNGDVLPWIWPNISIGRTPYWSATTTLPNFIYAASQWSGASVATPALATIFVMPVGLRAFPSMEDGICLIGVAAGRVTPPTVSHHCTPKITGPFPCLASAEISSTPWPAILTSLLETLKVFRVDRSSPRNIPGKLAAFGWMPLNACPTSPSVIELAWPEIRDATAMAVGPHDIAPSCPAIRATPISRTVLLTEPVALAAPPTAGNTVRIRKPSCRTPPAVPDFTPSPKRSTSTNAFPCIIVKVPRDHARPAGIAKK